jgi:hypothetical protein
VSLKQCIAFFFGRIMLSVTHRTNSSESAAAANPQHIKFVPTEYFWMEGWGAKTIHKNNPHTLGDEAFEMSRI